MRCMSRGSNNGQQFIMVNVITARNKYLHTGTVLQNSTGLGSIKKRLCGKFNILKRLRRANTSVCLAVPSLGLSQA